MVNRAFWKEFTAARRSHSGLPEPGRSAGFVVIRDGRSAQESGFGLPAAGGTGNEAKKSRRAPAVVGARRHRSGTFY